MERNDVVVNALLEACRATVKWAETPQNHGGNPWCMEHVQMADNALKMFSGQKPEWKKALAKQTTT